MNEEFIKLVGTTPYESLENSDRIALSTTPLGDLQAIIEVAAKRQPPNTTILCAVSALCLARADMLGDHRMIGPLMVHQSAIRALPQ